MVPQAGQRVAAGATLVLVEQPRVVERDRGVLDKCLQGLAAGAVSTARDFQEPEDPAPRPEREAKRSWAGVIGGREDPHLERREQPVGLRLDSAHAVALTGR